MAEVYAYGDGTVVKLDRLEWSGVSAFESEVLVRLAAAGLPVSRSHGVVTIEGRCGVVLDRVEGAITAAELLDRSGPSTVDALADPFRRTLQRSINRTAIDGLPDLVARLHDEVGAGRPRVRWPPSSTGSRPPSTRAAAASVTSISIPSTCWSARASGRSSTG